ncbi:MAG TPA: M67 family metallopeptidase [Candidatus Acidoferrum sp.]|nr:M67 family metallopeptidase [Candidatus Acidoferrum sp.]
MADSTTLSISSGLAERIRKHGAETYPHECCGALLGRDAGLGSDQKRVREVLDCLPLVNRRDDSPNNRFSIAPMDVIEADRVAQARGIELIGWYHSHPDHPARPSEYDRNHAWPWFSYIIVSVHAGVPKEMASWRLNDDRTEYSQEAIEIQSEAIARP